MSLLLRHSSDTTNRKVTPVFIRLFFLLVAIAFSFGTVRAQTAGLIYKPATGNVLDPNGDGYASTTRSGFQGSDVTDSEIDYFAIPQMALESSGDLATGSAGGHTDLVDSGSRQTVSAFFDGANLLFRFRLGGQSSASKGYTVLMDADGIWSGTGANPGFDYEVLLATNFNVRIIRLSDQAVMWTGSLDTYHQRVIARTTTDGNPDYFYDYYIPLSAFDGGITSATALRMAASTVTSAQSGVSGTISDVLGVNFSDYGYSAARAWNDIIQGSLTNTLQDIQSGGPGFGLMITSTPRFSGNLSAGQVQVTGTSLESDGATITIYSGGSSIGSGTVTSHSFNITVTALTGGSLITAKAQASGKLVSSASAPVTVRPGCTATASTTPTSIVQESNKRGYQGTAQAGAKIRMYGPENQAVTPAGAGYVTADGTGHWSYLWCATGANCIPQGTYFLTAQRESQNECESPLSEPMGFGNTGTTSTPAIVGSPTSSSTTVTIRNLDAGVATLYLYVNGRYQSHTGSTIATNGTYVFTGLALFEGDVVSARARVSGKDISAAVSASIPMTASGTSNAPSITGTYVNGGTTVRGTSTEGEGTTITVYKAGTTALGTNTVTAFGTWTVTTSPAIATADVLTAKATAAGKNQSSASTGITVLGGQSPAPTVTGPIFQNSTSITGSSSSGTVTVYINGSPVGTTTGGASWTLSGIDTREIFKGAIISATLTQAGNSESVSSNLVTVTGVDHFEITSSGGGALDIRTAGTPFDLRITARDAGGGIVSTFAGRTTLTSDQNILSGNGLTQTFSSGQLDPHAVTLTLAGSNEIEVVATDDPFTTGTSGVFLVDPGPAAQLVIVQQPTTGTRNQVLVPDFSIAIEDAYGNRRTADTTPITAATSASGTLSGTLTQAAEEGVASFPDLRYNVTETIQVGFSGGGLPVATSGDVAVVSAAPGSSTPVAGTPQSTTVLTAYATNLSIEVRDAGNAPLSGTTVWFTAPADGASGTFAGGNRTISTVTNGSGVATAPVFTANQTAGTFAVDVVVSGLEAGTTFNLTNLAGSPTTIARINGDGQSGDGGDELSDSLVVGVADAGGNPVAGVSVTFTVTDKPAHAIGQTLSPVTTTTDAGGRAATSFKLGNRAGEYTIAAASAGLTGSPVSFTATANTNGNAGPAVRLILSGDTTQTAGTTNPLTITALDAAGETATDYAGNKILTFSGAVASPDSSAPTIVDKDGQAIPFGDPTGITFAAGRAEVDGIKNGPMTLFAAESVLISVTDGDLSTTGTDRLPVVVAAAAGSRFAATQSGGSTPVPDNTYTAGVPFSVRIRVFDAFGNTATAYRDSVSITSPAFTGSVQAAIEENGYVDDVTLLPTVAGAEHRLTVSDGSVQSIDASGAFTVQAGSAARLVLAGSSSQLAGDVNALTITAYDMLGNRAVSYEGAKLLTFTGAGSTAGFDPTVTDRLGAAQSFGTPISVTFTEGRAAVSGAANGVMRLYRRETATISVTDGEFTTNGADRLEVNVSAAAPDHLMFVTQPGNGISGLPLSTQPVIALRDVYENTVTGVPETVTVALDPSSAHLAGSSVQPVDTTTGTAVFTGLAVDPGGTGYTLLATGSLVNKEENAVTSSTFNVVAGNIARFAIARQPSTRTRNADVLDRQPAVQLQDALGHDVAATGLTITVAVHSGGGVLTGVTSAQTDTSGRADFTGLKLTGAAGPRTLVFTTSGLPDVTSDTVVVTPGQATHLHLAVQPSATATAGAAFARQPVVHLLDVSDNLAVDDQETTVTARLHQGTGTLGGTLTATADSGVVTFTGLNHTVAETITIDLASAEMDTVTTEETVIRAAAPDHLMFVTQPGNGISGLPLSTQPVIALRDVYENTVTGVPETVSVALDPSSAHLAGTTVQPVDTTTGTAVFTGLSVDPAGTGYTLLATGMTISTGEDAVVSSTFDVVGGDAALLAIARQPSTRTRNADVLDRQPAIQLQDALGHDVAAAGLTITVAVHSGGGVLTGVTSAQTDTSGRADFTGLKLTGAAGPRTLVFTTSGLPDVTSDTVVVTPGQATHLHLAVQPSDTATAGAAFTRQPVVHLLDVSDNLAVDDQETTVTARMHQGTGTLGGTLTATADSGVVTFAGLNHTVAETITIDLASADMDTVTTEETVIQAAAAHHLVFVEEPADARAGEVIVPSVGVRALDAYGNPVLQAGRGITLTVNEGQLMGTTTRSTAASGIALFDDLYMTSSGTERRLTASSASLAPAQSQAFQIVPGSALRLIVSGATSLTAGVATPLTLTVKDAGGNIVTTYTGPKSITFTGPPAATVPSTITDRTGTARSFGSSVSILFTSGVATVSSESNGMMRLTRTGSFWISATDGTLAAIGSDRLQVTVNPGPAAVLAVVPAQTTVVAGSTTPISIRTTATDALGNGIPGLALTFAATRGTIPSTATTAEGGAVTVPFTAPATTGPVDITAEADEITGQARVSVLADAPSLAASRVTASPTTVVADGVAVAQIKVELMDTQGNALGQSAGTVTLAVTSGTLSAVTDRQNGTYEATLRSTRAGTSGVTAFLGDQPLADQAQVVFTPGPWSAEHSTLTAEPAVLPADGDSRTIVRVRLNDANENAVSASAGVLTLAATLGTLSEVVDHNDGTYEASLTAPSTSGQSIITAAIGGQSLKATARVTFEGQGVSLSRSTLTASPNEVTADGTSSALVTAILRDSSGTRLPTGGARVTFSATAGTLSTVIDGADGSYSARLTAPSEPASAVIRGFVDGAEMSAQATVTFTSAEPARLEVLSGTDQEDLPGTTLADSLVFRLVSADGEPVAGRPVTFAVTGAPESAGGQAVLPASATTTVSGRVSTRFVLGDRPGQYTIEARSTGAVAAAITATAINVPPAFVDTVNTVVFDGEESSYLWVADQPDLNTDALTMELWVRPGTSLGGTLFQKWGEQDPTQDQYRLWLENDSLRFSVRQEDQGEVTIVSPGDFEQEEASKKTGSQNGYLWTHVAAVADPAGKTIRLFTNGLQVASAPYSGILNRGTAQVRMGSGFKGEFHEVRMWDVARTANQLQASKNIRLEGDENDLVLYLTFDERDGTTSTDQSGNNNDAHLNDGVGRNRTERNTTEVSLREDDGYILTFGAIDEEDETRLDIRILALPEQGTLYQLAASGSDRITSDVSRDTPVETVPSAIHDPYNRLLYVPAGDFFGPDSLRFSATDDYGNYGEFVQRMKVLPVNDAPVLGSLPSISFNQRDRLAFELAPYVSDRDDRKEDLVWDFTLPPTAYRPEGDSLVVSYTPSNTSLLFTTTPLFSGMNIPVNVTVHDPSGLGATQVLNVSALFLNDPPSPFGLVYPADGDTVQRSQASFTWNHSTDLERAALTYTLHLKDAQGSVVDVTDLVDTTFTINKEVLRDGQSYTWFVTASDGTVEKESLQERSFHVPELPLEYALMQNYPNPAFQTAVIEYRVPEPSEVTITLYDLLGRSVLELVRSPEHEGGVYRLPVNLNRLSSGVYFYRMVARGGKRTPLYQQTRRLTVVH